MSLNNSKFVLTGLVWFMWSAFAGCARTVAVPPPSPAPPPSASKTLETPLPSTLPRPQTPPPKVEPAPPPEERVEPEQRPTPRAVASLGLTEQGKALLESRKVDDAIEVLERAMSLNPTNGENYYYLAEAWLDKGERKQAEEFNRLAGMYLEGDRKWMAKVEEQAKQIRKRRK